MNNNMTNKDKGVNCTSDLLKLFSSHVQEHSVLKRHKSLLDVAKWKKLRELNNDEDMFLREYEKYISPKNRRNKRAPMDAELVRVNDDYYNTKKRSNRIKMYSSDTSIDRDAICSECPYSLDSWNKLVASEHSVVERNKQDILLSGSTEEQGAYDTETDMLLEDQLKAGTRLHERIHTLTPSNKGNDNSVEGVIDTVTLDIQSKLKTRGRRNTVAHCTFSGKHIITSLDSALKLPSIGKKPGSNSSMKKSHPVSDQQPLYSSAYEHIEGHGLPFRDNKIIKADRRLSLNDGLMKLDIPPPVSNIRRSSAYSAWEGEKNDMFYIQTSNSGKVANATIVVQGDLADIKNTGNNSTLTESDCEKLKNTEQSTTSGSLLGAPGTAPSLVQNNHDKDQTKHVSFGQVGSNNQRDNKSRWDDCIGQITRSRRRRTITGTAGLKLLVDSQHGAAKLRYIVRLATEMEREALGKHTAKKEQDLHKEKVATDVKSREFSGHLAESESDLYNELNGCRYLRITPKKDSKS